MGREESRKYRDPQTLDELRLVSTSLPPPPTLTFPPLTPSSFPPISHSVSLPFPCFPYFRPFLSRPVTYSASLLPSPPRPSTRLTCVGIRMSASVPWPSLPKAPDPHEKTWPTYTQIQVEGWSERGAQGSEDLPRIPHH